MRILPAALVLLLLPVSVFAADAGPSGPSELIFLGQLVALLACGRLLGELMQRIGQPAVMGQLIGGILLGPSVLGGRIVGDLALARGRTHPQLYDRDDEAERLVRRAA